MPYTTIPKVKCHAKLGYIKSGQEVYFMNCMRVPYIWSMCTLVSLAVTNKATIKCMG